MEISQYDTNVLLKYLFESAMIQSEPEGDDPHGG